MTKLKAYESLTNAFIHWNRVDARTIMVWASSDGNGSHHPHLDRITAFLKQAGFVEFERDFDRICGKGFAIYKEPKERVL